MIFFLSFMVTTLKAQVEKVIVEKYYVSDANDATDTTGGFLDNGSTTYRVYIQLTPGSKIKKLFGDSLHALRIASTEVFFNNKVDGQSFAKDFPKNRYQENTVALDTWLTLGQTTRVGAKTYFGVLKSQDDDGSFIGGINNDGGSAAISNGLISNTDPSAGIPVTTSDGMDTMNVLPTSWADYGILSAGVDSTIFGSIKSDTSFISNNMGLQNSGATGVNPDSNQVLVAQLTTKGEISFELNVLVEVPGIVLPVKYVSKFAPGDFNSDTLRISPYLTYPLACGCKDANYLEYNNQYSCSNSDSCKTLIKFGCTDTAACNYDADANFNLPSICCYPGYCNDRDLSVICPNINDGRLREPIINLYPNPSTGKISLEIAAGENEYAEYKIYNSLGQIVEVGNIGFISGDVSQLIDVSKIQDGIYLIRLNCGNRNSSKIFTKN